MTRFNSVTCRYGWLDSGQEISFHVALSHESIASASSWTSLVMIRASDHRIPVTSDHRLSK